MEHFLIQTIVRVQRSFSVWWRRGRRQRKAQRIVPAKRLSCKKPNIPFTKKLSWPAVVSMLLLLVALAGCSSSTSINAGPISITNANGATSGQLASIAVSAKANVSMTPVNDKQGAGVDWTVNCGGSPVNGSTSGGACGTISPAHTPDGGTAVFSAPSAIPVGNTVTLTATVTSDPSATSSAALTILPLPIVVSWLPGEPTQVGTGETVNFSVNVANDPTDSGVTWSATCGSGSCGSFKGSTYTAPAAPPQPNGTVTITATSVADPTKSASMQITIVTVSISVNVSPASMYVSTSGSTRIAKFMATVLNDSTGMGVDWSLSLSGGTACNPTSVCGQITSHTASGVATTYVGPTTAPAGNAVIITATATATEQPPAVPVTAAATATIVTTAPIVIMVSTPPPSSMTPGQTATIAATTANDSQNYGVNWTASCAGPGSCGTFSASHTASGVSTAYTAPANLPSGQEVVITAASAAPSGTAANSATAVTTITAAPPTIAFQQQPPSTLPANGQAQVSAVVTNDVVPGGVTWTVHCGNSSPGACGSILPYQTASGAGATYTAPPVPSGGAITIQAASTADSSVTAMSTPVSILPSTALSVRFVPVPPTQLTEAGSVYLNAAVANDSTQAGMDWQVCASGCGFFTVQPAIPAIPATPTTPYVPPVPAVTATSVSGWSNGLPILYTAPATPPNGGTLTITVTAHADGRTSSTTVVTIASSDTGPALYGTVMAGTQPVAGASVSLYATGASGYGSASSLVYAPNTNPAIITDANGKFTLPAGYSCPQATSEMYLIATGGSASPGLSNPSLALMTALGPCGALSSSPVVINEVTTVASAWAVSRFAANPLSTGLTTYLNIGAPGSNVTGLANAFAQTYNLVDIGAGKALFTVPAGNANVPYAELNTLADILNACTVTGGGTAGDGTPCGILLEDANPYRGQPFVPYSGVPTDTLQAAFEIAQNPAFGLQGSAYTIDGQDLFPLATLASPFQPSLTKTPADFSIALNFTGGGGLQSTTTVNDFAVDASGNLWMTDSGGNSVIEWGNLGAAISPSTGLKAASLSHPGAFALDASGNLWICDQNGITELYSWGVEAQQSPFSGGGLLQGNSCQSIAIDGLGNVWATSRNSVSKFDSFGNPLSPASGFTIPTSPANPALVASILPQLAIDDANNVWLGVSAPLIYLNTLSLAELSNTTGVPNYLTPQPVTGIASNFVNTQSLQDQSQIAVDASGGVWIPDDNGNLGTVNRVPAYAGLGTTDVLTTIYAGNGVGGSLLSSPRGVAIDGAGNGWVGSIGNSGQSIPPSVIRFNSSGSAYGFSSTALANRPQSIAIDSTGNVWVLLNNNTINEFMGVATPAVVPLSLAVKNKKIGATP